MTVRWGVIGPGGIASRFAEAMRVVPDGTIHAVASRSAERAAAYADRFEVPQRYGAYEELVADPQVDVVYVATPHTCHAEHTLLALEAGKHVLCEKPFALNAAQAEQMASAARAKGLFLMEAMWSRFLPAYSRLVDLLRSEAIGEVCLVEADLGLRFPFQSGHRLFDLALGGGAALDLGIYPLQLASLVLGPPDSLSARAVIGASGVDEVVAAVLQHRGGTLSVVKAALSTHLACTARIAGANGVIELPSPMHCPPALLVRTQTGLEEIDCSWQGDGMQFQIGEVHRCLGEGIRESSVMPLQESVELAVTLDLIRAQIGLVYPGE